MRKPNTEKQTGNSDKKKIILAACLFVFAGGNIAYQQGLFSGWGSEQQSFSLPKATTNTTLPETASQNANNQALPSAPPVPQKLSQANHYDKMVGIYLASERAASDVEKMLSRFKAGNRIKIDVLNDELTRKTLEVEDSKTEAAKYEADMRLNVLKEMAKQYESGELELDATTLIRSSNQFNAATGEMPMGTFDTNNVNTPPTDASLGLQDLLTAENGSVQGELAKPDVLSLKSLVGGKALIKRNDKRFRGVEVGHTIDMRYYVESMNTKTGCIQLVDVGHEKKKNLPPLCMN